MWKARCRCVGCPHYSIIQLHVLAQVIGDKHVHPDVQFIVVTNRAAHCVLAESISTMARRTQERRRAADLDLLLTRLLTDYPRDNIMWVLPDVPLLYSEIVGLVRSSGGELNFNDALIALSCRHRGIPLIASFDRDFDHVAWLRRISHPDDIS